MLQFLNMITSGFHGDAAPIMYAILIMGFASLGVILERTWFLYVKCGANSNSFMSGVLKYLKSGDYDKATRYAQSVNTPLAKIIRVVLQNRGKGYKIVQRAVDEVFLTESPRVTRFLPFLQAFANIAVLVGLLGAIYGFMEAFSSLANVPAAQRSQALAASIAVVMSSTLWGLIVSILALFGHTILATKSDRILEEMDEKSAKLINLVEE